MRSRARTVSASSLASRLQTVQVLGLPEIKNLIKESVQTAVVHLEEQLIDDQRQRLLQEAEEIFKQRLEAFRADRADREAKIKHLQKQLKIAETLLDEERNKIVSANQFTVSDAGMVELETRLGRMLDRAIKGGGVSDELAQEMSATVARLLDSERDNIRRKAEEAQGERVALLERKIERLAKTLEKAEGDRDRERRRAEILERATAGPGFTLTRDPGILDEDPKKERKLQLMKEIFLANKEMRRALEEKGLLRRIGEPPVAQCQTAADEQTESGPPAADTKELVAVAAQRNQTEENRSVGVSEDPARQLEDESKADQKSEGDTSGGKVELVVS